MPYLMFLRKEVFDLLYYVFFTTATFQMHTKLFLSIRPNLLFLINSISLYVTRENKHDVNTMGHNPAQSYTCCSF